jgi:hypothetical protein
MSDKKAVIQLSDFQGAGIIHGRRFNGSTEALLDRVPRTPGIYAFFKDIELNTVNPAAFYNDLTREMLSKKFVDREGTINPLYQVTLRSKTEIPKSKLDQIRALSEHASFRTSVAQAMKLSLLFQSPLYVGKANDLRARLRQHYDPSSPLSHRLASAGTSIHKTSVVLLPVLDNTLNETSAAQDKDDASDDEANSDDENQNEVFEEIFSRIFSPLFTIRYG